ncbi:MAG: HupE/UreJ family protein [Calditrichaeota bacterium]|nr:MAG: HupE/UreJ family protein [Calditrichota bacterium]
MSEINLYFRLGIEHILAIDSFDHILFVIALCVAYPLSMWRQILILVTAFTIGHSLTLALATFRIVIIDVDFIEFLIPITILITSVGNFITKPEVGKNILYHSKYLIALIFGLIHGLGFSNYLILLLNPDEKLFIPLGSFNIGVEAGQIIIVIAFGIITWFFTIICKIKHEIWSNIVSATVAVTAFFLLLKQ